MKISSIVIVILLCFHICCYSQTNEKNGNDVHDMNAPVFICTPEPQFPGGVDSLKSFLKRNLKYPTSHCAPGIVYVQFTVDSTGVITNPKIIKGVCEAYDNEVLRVISIMPKMIPAYGKGNRPMSLQWNLPIKFGIN